MEFSRINPNFRAGEGRMTSQVFLQEVREYLHHEPRNSSALARQIHYLYNVGEFFLPGTIEDFEWIR